MSNSPDPKSPAPNLGLIVSLVVGLGGFVTLAIVLGVLLVGLAIDRALDTRPLFTIGLMVLSAPVSIFAMYRVSTAVIARTVNSQNAKK